MSLNNEIIYYLIFDTNALFQAYEKKADFTSFSFNATFENVVDMINQLDIYNQVTVAIPSVVWNEMEKQIIEKHDELLLSYKNTITKKLFPEYSIFENPAINYPEYIKNKIVEYKEEITKGLNRVIEIPVASNNRFESIINLSLIHILLQIHSLMIAIQPYEQIILWLILLLTFPIGDWIN